MNSERDEDDVLRRALDAVAALGPCRAEAGFLAQDGAPVPAPAEQPQAPGLTVQVRRLHGGDGPVTVPGRAWAWAFALRTASSAGADGTRHSTLGHLVCSAQSPPGDDARYVLHVLAQQTAVALAATAARLGARGRARELAASVEDLEHQHRVHEALNEALASGAGVAGTAETVHRLTGRPVAVEDRFGNLLAWAGPGRPDPYPKPDAAQHEGFLQGAARWTRPVRMGKRLVTVARHCGEVLGAVALVDADGGAGPREEFTLGRASTVIARELAHARSIADVELRLRRELVDDLIHGTDDAGAYRRAAAVGHDLHGTHHLAAVRWTGRATDKALVQAIGRSAASLRIPALLAGQPGMVVLVLQGDPRPEALYHSVARELGSAAGAIGAGDCCATPGEIPRSYREALRALEVRRQSCSPHGGTAFDELGLYRILGPGGDQGDTERFVREWLGPLLDYDAAHHSDLMQTLYQYFECGGNYNVTAAALTIHRSTLRYRLQRIREISGRDLRDVDSRLNLHVAARVWRVMGKPFRSEG
ncbi:MULTISPECIES: helix-turn-helix domain-containing protein [unclassified Streptomyces]|uniref:PucR family transcriptional regulator n=1 Tax=unclassified Streptomyces TaxID=2593676 RepID=UPI002E153394|nr:helix-turn-helix domain-containing protein [Streptomyces sp. NBC_01197]WSS52987.1 helix-turn-helix domain-containing protein [Streptomyces sp. NBC_01180]